MPNKIKVGFIGGTTKKEKKKLSRGKQEPLAPAQFNNVTLGCLCILILRHSDGL